MFNNSLLSLLQLADPTLPIGAYAHSGGLETYVQQHKVKDRQTAKDYVTAMLTRSLHYTDAAFVSLAYDAAARNELEEIMQLEDECTAVKWPLESRQASQKLGIRLIKIFQTLCANQITEAYNRAIRAKEIDGNYCIAFGLYAFALAIPKAEALGGFYYNSAVGMVTNCVKLIPLGQQHGQELLFSLHPLIEELVLASLAPDRAMIGYGCAGSDIRCMQHEQLYSRLYMS